MKFLRHQTAMESIFTLHALDKMTWEVRGDLSNNYLVKRFLHSACCHLICPKCKICIHMYTCSCEDYNLNFKICKHMHYIKMSEVASKENNVDLPSAALSEDPKSFVVSLSSQTKNKKKDCLFDKVNETFIKLQNSNLNDLDDSTIVEMHKHLNILNNLVDLPTPSAIDTFVNKNGTNASPNANIIPQLRLFSTKKKRKRSNSNKKPSENQIMSINNLLSNMTTPMCRCK